MKKLMYVAMVAFAFMACQPQNPADLPVQEKKAVEVVTKGGLAMLGGAKADVVKQFTDAGYKQVDANTGNQIRARFPKAQADAMPSAEYLSFVYGIDPSAAKADSLMIAAMRNALLAGTNVITAGVRFSDGKCVYVDASVTAPVTVDGALVYTNGSNDLYAAKPGVWGGSIRASKGNRIEYAKHADYIAALKDAKGIEANEEAVGVKGELSYVYSAWLLVMSEEEEAEMKKEVPQGGMPPYVNCDFQVKDAAYIN